MIWAILVPLIWLVGAITFYVLDGYYDFDLIGSWYDYRTHRYENHNIAAPLSLLWPVVMWIVIASSLRKKSEQLRDRRAKQRREREEEERKVRIEVEKEMRKLDGFDEDVYQEAPKKKAKRARC